jgi:hypothetical protein
MAEFGCAVNMAGCREQDAIKITQIGIPPCSANVVLHASIERAAVVKSGMPSNERMDTGSSNSRSKRASNSA